MAHYDYRTQGTCSQYVSFDLEDGKLHNVTFLGGCPGNTLAIGKLVEGFDAQQVHDILRGNPCGGRPTSCGDQLARAIEVATANA